MLPSRVTRLCYVVFVFEILLFRFYYFRFQNRNKAYIFPSARWWWLWQGCSNFRVEHYFPLVLFIISMQGGFSELKSLTLSLSDSIMETCSVVLTFRSVDEILWCDHLNETSLAVLLHGTICFSLSYKMKFGIFLELWLLALLGVKQLS